MTLNNVKKIKGAADKNGLLRVNKTLNRWLTFYVSIGLKKKSITKSWGNLSTPGEIVTQIEKPPSPDRGSRRPI